MPGSTLLTCGTGKTSSRIAKRLQALDVPILLTSRKGHQAGGVVTFDWYGESTFANPFAADTIDTVYIVLPPPQPGADVVAVKKFIDLAKEKGVNRFLLMSGSIIPKGSPTPHGQIHAYLESLGVDYAVLKPSWFFDNFLSRMAIKETDELVSAAGTGKIGFISEEDIADIAVDLLVAPKLGGIEKVIVGPDLVSFDEAAAMLTQVLGRKISHRKVSIEERTAISIQEGIPPELAAVLAFIEGKVIAEAGEDEKMYNSPEAVVGKSRLKDFFEANQSAWLK